MTDKEELNFNEAPASMTIRGFYHSFSVMVTKRQDKPEIKNFITEVPLIIRTMEELGFKPDWTKDTPPAFPNAPQAPKCGVHGVDMVWREGTSKAGKHYAFWACPERNADGSFCAFQHKETKV